MLQQEAVDVVINIHVHPDNLAGIVDCVYLRGSGRSNGIFK